MFNAKKVTAKNLNYKINRENFWNRNHLNLKTHVWKNDCLSFSRRVGEIWEPFRKLCFEYPINKLQLIFFENSPAD